MAEGDGHAMNARATATVVGSDETIARRFGISPKCFDLAAEAGEFLLRLGPKPPVFVNGRRGVGPPQRPGPQCITEMLCDLDHAEEHRIHSQATKLTDWFAREVNDAILSVKFCWFFPRYRAGKEVVGLLQKLPLLA